MTKITLITAAKPVAPPSFPPLDADLDAGLRRLKLAAIRRTAPAVLITAKTQGGTPEEVLRTLVETELAARDASNVVNRLKAAAFPVPKTLESFDVTASSIPPKVFDYLSNLEWIREQRNLAPIGPPGPARACLHHTDVSLALQEARRVLSPGGRFGAWDPWRAMLYGVGIAVFGKRDPDVDCRPLDPIRIAEFEAIFPGGQVIHHGTLSRYPAIAANKLGLRIGIRSMSRLMDWDDRVTKKFERLRRNGSSVALLGEKS